MLSNRRTERLIIFDLDNTLIPLAEAKIQGSTVSFAHEHWYDVDRYEKAALAAICEATRLGSVYIVTNSSMSMVDISLPVFPALREIIISRQVPIISARDHYEHEYPEQPLRWKTIVIQQLFRLHSWICATTIGDSLSDMQALHDNRFVDGAPRRMRFYLLDHGGCKSIGEKAQLLQVMIAVGLHLLLELAVFSTTLPSRLYIIFSFDGAPSAPSSSSSGAQDLQLVDRVMLKRYILHALLRVSMPPTQLPQPQHVTKSISDEFLASAPEIYVPATLTFL